MRWLSESMCISTTTTLRICNLGWIDKRVVGDRGGFRWILYDRRGGVRHV